MRCWYIFYGRGEVQRAQTDQSLYYSHMHGSRYRVSSRLSSLSKLEMLTWTFDVLFLVFRISTIISCQIFTKVPPNGDDRLSRNCIVVLRIYCASEGTIYQGQAVLKYAKQNVLKHYMIYSALFGDTNLMLHQFRLYKNHSVLRGQP